MGKWIYYLYAKYNFLVFPVKLDLQVCLACIVFVKPFHAGLVFVLCVCAVVRLSPPAVSLCRSVFLRRQSTAAAAAFVSSAAPETRENRYSVSWPHEHPLNQQRVSLTSTNNSLFSTSVETPAADALEQKCSTCFASTCLIRAFWWSELVKNVYFQNLSCTNNTLKDFHIISYCCS